MIMQRETSGLNTFVGKFSLPSLIFISLCQLDLSSVNWMFILAIFISKIIIFFVVVIITVVVTRPTNIARAGLLAIFCTQTNDFAIGVPIVAGLYGKTHPEFVAYLYLMAPISLTILNPFGFVLMELGKQTPALQNSQNIEENTRWVVIRNVVRNIITNPIVFMTALGMIGNYVFDHQPPAPLTAVLNVFGSAFIGTALMMLGLRMVGQVHKLQGVALLVPSLLIITKLLITPLVMREMVSLFVHNLKNPTEILDLTTFSFLYGTIPSAPGVFVYATAYALDESLIAASMVACTFLSAPLMFISAKMIAASNTNPDKTDHLLDVYEFDISALSLVGGLIVILVFIVKKKFRFPHRLTLLLVIAQVIGCINSFLKYYGVSYKADLIQISSDMCADLCAASLAIAFLFIHSRADQTLSNVQPALIILPWGIPMCLSTILLSLDGSLRPKKTFEDVSSGLSTSVLMFSLIVCVICLVMAERNRRKHARYISVSEDELPSSISGGISSNNVHDKSPTSNKYETWFDGPLIPNLDSSGDMNARYSGRNENIPACCEDDMQLLRHFIFLVFIVCSFIVSLALLLWKLMGETKYGLHLEMSFIEITLRRGQAFFAFCVFALDYRNIIKPTIKWFVKLWYGGEPISLPKWDELPFETRLICDQFVTQHLKKCKIDIEKTHWSSLLYGASFSGSSLVDWLIHNCLVKDSEEAGAYASKLLSGRVIRHIYNTEFFYNSPSMFYIFIAGN